MPTVTPAEAAEPSGHRVYDDEDEEFQAALRASLASMPEEFVPPPSPLPVRAPPQPQRPSLTESVRSSGTTAVATPPLEPVVSSTSHDDDDDDEAPLERLSSPPPVEETVDVDEMRRRRLARFGANS